MVFMPQSGYIHPDEFFQSVEVVTGDILGTDTVRTWEFNVTAPIRFNAFLFIHYWLVISGLCETKALIKQENSVFLPKLTFFFHKHYFTCEIQEYDFESHAVWHTALHPQSSRLRAVHGHGVELIRPKLGLSVTQAGHVSVVVCGGLVRLPSLQALPSQLQPVSHHSRELLRYARIFDKIVQQFNRTGKYSIHTLFRRVSTTRCLLLSL